MLLSTCCIFDHILHNSKYSMPLYFVGSAIEEFHILGQIKMSPHFMPNFMTQMNSTIVKETICKVLSQIMAGEFGKVFR